jgi:hypothetical protein
MMNQAKGSSTSKAPGNSSLHQSNKSTPNQYNDHMTIMWYLNLRQIGEKVKQSLMEPMMRTTKAWVKVSVLVMFVWEGMVSPDMLQMVVQLVLLLSSDSLLNTLHQALRAWRGYEKSLIFRVPLSGESVGCPRMFD